MLFKHHFNAKEFSTKGERNRSLPSLTIKDKSMSVQEIVRRFASGLPLTGIKTTFYEEDPELPYVDFAKMDLAEREAHLKQASDHVANLKKQMRKLAADKKAQEQQKLEQLQLELKQQQQQQPGKGTGA